VPQATLPASPTDPNQTQSATADSAASSAVSPAGSASSPKGLAPGSTVPAVATVPAPAAVPPGTAVVSQTSAAAAPSAPAASKLAASKPAIDAANTNDKKDVAAIASNTELPGEKSAIILSSKGAEKRLAHSIPPKYPSGASSGQAQETVVLKEVVDESGRVEGVRLVEGNAVLATAAIKAVKQWRYRPYVRDGKAQPFQTVVILDFQRP
jgi:TonB family protein